MYVHGYHTHVEQMTATSFSEENYNQQLSNIEVYEINNASIDHSIVCPEAYR